MRFPIAALTLLALLAPTAASAWWGDDCDLTDARDASVELAGATEIEVLARAGSLRIEGMDGLDRVEAEGEACSSDRELLDEIRIEVTRHRERIRVEARIPERRRESGRLDLEVRVPRGVRLFVEDSSGELEIRGVGPLELEDGSGAIRLTDIDGDLRIEDGSGEIEVDGVTGSVRITDGSGEIDVRDVAGSVEVRDGSGSIRLAEVRGDAIVDEDGSGDIDVRDVTGDVEVRRDGSGGIRTARVGGEVRRPNG